MNALKAALAAIIIVSGMVGVLVGLGELFIRWPGLGAIVVLAALLIAVWGGVYSWLEEQS